MERGVLISGARCGTNRLERDGPVSNGFGEEYWNLLVQDIYTTRAIVGSHAGAGWLPALSKTIGICLSCQ